MNAFKKYSKSTLMTKVSNHTRLRCLWWPVFPSLSRQPKESKSWTKCSSNTKAMSKSHFMSLLKCWKVSEKMISKLLQLFLVTNHSSKISLFGRRTKPKDSRWRRMKMKRRRSSTSWRKSKLCFLSKTPRSSIFRRCWLVSSTLRIMLRWKSPSLWLSTLNKRSWESAQRSSSSLSIWCPNMLTSWRKPDSKSSEKIEITEFICLRVWNSNLHLSKFNQV